MLIPIEIQLFAITLVLCAILFELRKANKK